MAEGLLIKKGEIKFEQRCCGLGWYNH